ncbi:MAG: AAA family ATPase [Gemmatimonadales bacterium]|nr:AAA family ATPase [Gemmatimonadales bacterium]
MNWHAPDLLWVKVDAPVLRAPRTNPPGGRITEDMLSPDQRAALDTLFTMLTTRTGDGKRTVLVLAGAAGTGKSAVMNVLIEKLASAGVNVTLLAPTGKAAARLKQATGRETSTIHGFIYGSPAQAGVCPSCDAASVDLGISETGAKKAGLTKLTCPSCAAEFSLAMAKKIEKRLGFTPKTGQSVATAPMVALIDEGSMVSRELDKDIRGLLPANYSVLYVGDKEQLPPVMKKGGSLVDAWGPDFAHADAELTQVHRQAADNPIIDLATRIRTGQNRYDPFKVTVPDPSKRVRVVRRSTPTQAAAWLAAVRASKADGTLIAYSNKLRQELNRLVRKARGQEALAYKEGIPVVRADRLLVLKNNRGAKLYNGEIVLIESSRYPVSAGLRAEEFIFVKLYKSDEFLIHGPTFGLTPQDFEDGTKDFTAVATRMEKAAIDPGDSNWDEAAAQALDDLDADDLFDAYGAIRSSELLHCDWGEAITAHKSQGSAWKHVGVAWDFVAQRAWDEQYELGRRWLYTSATRASETLVLFDMT